MGAQFAAVRSSSLSCYHPSLLIPTQSLSPNSKRPFAKMVSATPKQRKIAIVGSRSVGKSSLTVQFVDGHFVESYYPTIENTFSKVIKYKNQEYATEIVDTAGQDEYSILNSITSSVSMAMFWSTRLLPLNPLRWFRSSA